MAEFNPSDLIETGSNAIPNGQAASVMRRSMENKNLLSEKGALYAGTGEPYATQDSVGNTYNTAITDAVAAPTQSGQVLVSNLDSGGPDTGLEWQNAAPNADNVNSSINGQPISSIFETNGTTVKNATNATNATKLTSGTVGSSTAPVYFNNGQPVACGNSLEVNITGNAATATNATKATTANNIEQTVIYNGEALSTGSFFTASEAIESGRRYLLVFDNGDTAEGIAFSSTWQGDFEDGYEDVSGSEINVGKINAGGDSANDILVNFVNVRAKQGATSWRFVVLGYNLNETTTFSSTLKLKKIIKCEKYDI